MGLRACLDGCGKFRPTGIRSTDRPVRNESLYRLSCPVPRSLFRHSTNATNSRTAPVPNPTTRHNPASVKISCVKIFFLVVQAIAFLTSRLQNYARNFPHHKNHDKRDSHNKKPQNKHRDPNDTQNTEGIPTSRITTASSSTYHHAHTHP